MYGYFGDAVSGYESQIKAQQARIKAARKAVWREKIFTNARRLAELNVNRLVVDLRTLQAKLRKAKRDAAAAAVASRKASSASGWSVSLPSLSISSGSTSLTQAQVDQVKAMVQQMIDSGADADTAEAQVTSRVLPARVRRFYPRGYFHPLGRRGPRPVLPQNAAPMYRPMPGEFAPRARDIDPRSFTRDIDPQMAGRNLGPFPAGRSIDPMVPQVGLIPGIGNQAGSFTFPPGNVSDTDPDLDSEMDADLSGGFDFSASNPWVLGGLALAAIYFVPKMLRKGKASAAVKSNPRRRKNRRKNRRNRR